MKYDRFYSKLEAFWQRRKRWILAALILVSLFGLSKYGQKNRTSDPYRARIEKQFSGYDGSHEKLEAYIKTSLNDPASYEHVSTSYALPADSSFNSVVVTTTFRAKNQFGAVVTKTIRARCDINTGRVESVLPD